MCENLDLVVVIMAGGAGTRFWPLSTEARPKQFLNLFGERTLLQLSYDRVATLVPPQRVLVLTSQRFVPLVRQQLPGLPEANVVGEPVRRDTAAAVALAALICGRRFGNPVMAVLTADHLIEPVELFQRTLRSAALEAANSGRALYTFGVLPSFPATGYGYLQRGQLLTEDEGVEHYQLLRFKEKPRLELAQEYLESGDYFWNSGMFAWTTNAILEELELQLPEHLQHLAPVVEQDGRPGWQQALEAGFEPLRKESIDFGVMEHARDVRCVAARFKWSDVGGWLALEEHMDRDGTGNVLRGDLRTVDAGDNLVFCEDDREVVALVGVRDLIVVRSGGRTLVVHRNATEEIKTLVQGLEQDLR
jgi:mannose-1-phosphate guanylyltransferase